MKPSSTISNIITSEIDPAFAKRAEFIISAIQKQKPKRVLDAGCGRGFYVKLVSLLDFPTEIIGVDLQEKYLKIAQEATQNDKRVCVKIASIYDLPYPNNYFDFVICSEVLEHVDNDKKAVAELHRVLKKNGTLVVTVPNTDFPFLWDPLNWILMKLFNTHVNKNIWWLAGIWADHERLYKKDDFGRLIENKFTIKQSKSIIHWCWPFSHFLLYGLGKNIVEKIGAKSFDRFNFTNKKPFSTILATFMRIPSSMFDNRINKDACVNHLILAIKP